MPVSSVVTRFAPSPTGTLHIGSARTALFNWLFTRRHGGQFLLRVEDTDKERSTEASTQAIYRGLEWLGLDFDGQPISQAANSKRHAEVAHAMLDAGHAYKCFATQDEIAAFRDVAHAEKNSTLFRSTWRDVADCDHPDSPYVVRLKAPRDGQTVIKDQVQGDVTIRNDQLDDMVLLRSDSTPVYMLAVVVDDHDMGVTHVIRGDDHLNNAARQIQIYIAMGWDLPVYAHIPLIHGPDGKKMSKRHGATGVEEYQALGYSAAGMRNYLARLGWSHGDDEFFTDSQAQSWFDLEHIGKSPSRFDFKKLANVSGQHIAQTENAALLHELQGYLAATAAPTLNDAQKLAFLKGVYCVKDRAKTMAELLEKSAFMLNARPLDFDQKAKQTLDIVSIGILIELTPQLQNVIWNREALEALVGILAESHNTKLGKLAAPLRAALSGRVVSPSVFDMMLVLGRDETIARLNDIS
jgi:glutamyl-tRNA synthetase|tara:strand:+ start:950 stop:2350 length:1401 start_codon:yes stop_codon:yes gene_type:complete